MRACASAREMWSALERESPALILLDLGLPDEDGLALIRRLRTRSQVPVVVLTARRERDDRITALKSGADDYVIKPVDPEELSLRVTNLLRRGSGISAVAGDALEFGGWKLDLTGELLRAPDGVQVKLTRAEFDVLTALARSPGRVLSRDYLLDAVARADDEGPSDRLIDVLVSRLRKKMETGGRARVVETVIGRGYKLSSSV